jgi:hypothetical protein
MAAVVLGMALQRPTLLTKPSPDLTHMSENPTRVADPVKGKPAEVSVSLIYSHRNTADTNQLCAGAVQMPPPNYMLPTSPEHATYTGRIDHLICKATDSCVHVIS